ncbi:MAG: DUF454 family protein [Alphaproteobacteria bacterium]|nr:DUF454 family protein [Alphaproteobacteria bacterium]
MTEIPDNYVPIESGARRAALLICGWCNVTLAMIGAVLPGVPTTIFLIIALWAFTRSSPRLQRWLFLHPRFGAALRDWDRHRVVPLRAKCFAAISMAISLVILAVVVHDWILSAAVGAIMVAVLIYLVTRPSHRTAAVTAKG